MSAYQRRSPGDGHLSEVRPGVWRLRVSVHTSKGRKFVTKTVYVKGRKAALAALREFAQECGEEAPEPGTVPTLGEIAEAWMENIERENRVAPATLDLYRRHLSNHILPALGGGALPTLGARRLDQFYASLSLAPSTIGTIHAVVMAALRQGLDWGVISALPRPRPPSVRQDERALLTPADVTALVRCAEEIHRPELALFILLGARTGARRGELLGLQVTDLDRTTCTLAIRRQITGEHGVGLPKNHKARVVAIGPKTVEAVDDYLGMVRDRFRREPGPWLLSEDGGTTPLAPNRVSEAMGRLGKKAGVAFHAHLLRHFHQSQLISAGVDVATVARRGGHRPEELLGTYTHAVTGTDVKAALLLEELTSG